MQELLRKLPDCVLGCDLYEDWLGIADMTPADAVPAIKRSTTMLSSLLIIVLVVWLAY